MRLFPEKSDTIIGAAEAMRQGDVACLDLVERCLARIDEWEPRVHAWVSVDREGARRRARELDAEIAAGRWIGPLHGIPVGIKDIVDVAGVATGAGSKLMTETIAMKDAAVVRKLRDAGAIVLGKTVTTQFASFDPPPTRNPWKLDRTPGGSSSGSAAAVAVGMCLGAIGSQTGGSITRPAIYCGVAGCKPTYGRVSLAGIVPLAPSLDHPGPIAGCVRDLAVLLDNISGHDPNDPHSVAAEFPPVHLVDFDSSVVRPPRIARLRGFFESRADPRMSAVFERALTALRSAGARIADAELPHGFADVHRQHRILMAGEMAAWHERRFREHRGDYLPCASELIEEGLSLDRSDFLNAKQHQAQTCGEIAAIFRDADVAVCPATPAAAPDASTTGDPAFNSPWSYTGLPTVSFAIGLDPDGLPVGIQFVGGRFQEPQLFRCALWCEDVLRRFGERMNGLGFSHRL